MLTRKDLKKAIELLSIYEEAFYPNSTSVSDIKEYLYWDDTLECFSIDAGQILRGDAESVRIYPDTEWVCREKETRNRHAAAVVDADSKIFFIEVVE